MKNLNLPSELMSYMTQNGKFVFVDDFSGWGAEADLDHFRREDTMEGNCLVAANGQTLGFQCVSMRRGNHLTVSLRDRETDTVQKLKLADLPLFQDFDVVIWTSGESLRGFAPLCSNKFELAIFLQNLADFGNKRDYSLSRTKNDMAKLAKFLYRNNPEKTKSILDDLD